MLLAAVTQAFGQLEVDANGNVGVGTSSPGANLDVVEDGAAAIVLVRGYRTSSGNAAIVRGRSARGSLASPSAVADEDVIATFQGQAYDGSGFSNVGRIRLVADGTISSGVVPGRMEILLADATGSENTAMRVEHTGNVIIGDHIPFARFSVSGNNDDQLGIEWRADNRVVLQTRLDGSGTATYGGDGENRLILQPDVGNVGIGTNYPGYKLQVNGTVRATSFISDTTTYSDFVFAPDYELPTLDEVEAHIAAEGHLPDIPSEEEAMGDGIDLAAMQVKLLQKVEELTLYVIQLKNENADQQREIENLKNGVTQ